MSKKARSEQRHSHSGRKATIKHAIKHIANTDSYNLLKLSRFYSDFVAHTKGAQELF